jgi:hypothetical protein
MSYRGPQDGAVVSVGSRDFTVVVDHSEDGSSAWYECHDCEQTVGFGDDALNDHDCQQCAGCNDWYPELPTPADQSFFPDSRRYCTDDCLQDASERYWMNVWTNA